MRRTVPLVTRAGMVGAVISALIIAGFPANALATGTPLFQPYQAIPVGSWPEAVAIGDVTGDGRSDVVMTTSFYFDPANDFRLWVFAQAPNGALFAPVSYPTAATYTHRAQSVAVGDITGDGKADVALGIEGSGVQVFPQLADGSLGVPTLYATSDSLRIRLGQLNGDGRLDVAGVGWGTNTVRILYNDGQGGLLNPVVYAAKHGGYDDLEVADVSNDGRDDLVVMSGQGFGPNISVLAQLPAGGFGTAAEYSVGGNVLTHGIGVGDVNGDGRKDVVASYGGNRPSSFIAVFTQTSAGKLAAPISYPSYDIPEPVDVADMDLDGRADVVTLHGGWLAAGVYRQQLDGSLAAEERYALPYASHYNPHGLAVGDFNGDGVPDVAVADYNSGLVVLRSSATPPPPNQLTALTAPQVWVGLRNSDDVGVKFDLRAEVYIGTTLVTSGEVNSVTAGSSGFVNAVLDTIPLDRFAPVAAPPGSHLSVQLFVRNACSGSTHNSGVARLWYNDSTANSSFGATIAGSASTYYLVAGNNLSTSPGAGPQASVDVAAGAKCSDFESFGTWSRMIP